MTNSVKVTNPKKNILLALSIKKSIVEKAYLGGTQRVVPKHLSLKYVY